VTAAPRKTAPVPTAVAALVPTLAPASGQAQAIHWVFVVTLLVCAAIFVLVLALVVYACVRFRSRPDSAPPFQDTGDTKREIAWTGGAIAVVGVLFVLTLAAMHSADPPVPDRTPDLVVRAHQWWWEVRYPASGVVTANEIHVPVGEKLVVRLESADVIHDFWVPQLGRKMDMIPGHPNSMWLEADVPGIYTGACSEFCGAGHAWMLLRVIAEPRADFEAWRRSQLRAPSKPRGAAERRGARLFDDKTCKSCHAIAGTAAAASLGPDLTHVAARSTLAAGVLANGRENLARWLTDPQAFKPGTLMPNLHLTSSQADDLAAYLWTLR
jgi:cytochrome c oxidase subunit 2